MTHVKIKNILRWFFILPGSILAYILSGLFFKFIIFLSSLVSVDTALIDIVFKEALQSGVSSFFFVVVGANISPNFKKETSLALLILLSMLYGIAFFSANFISKDYLSNLSLISGIVGSIVGYYQILNNYDDYVLFD